MSDIPRPPLATKGSLSMHLRDWRGTSYSVTTVELSAILARQGVTIIGHTGNDEHLGGLIQVTESVHIELNKDGRGAVVVKALKNAAEFKLYERRMKMRDLIFDLLQAGAIVVH